MNMLEILEQAVEDEPGLYHEFLLSYKSTRKCIYGFVEGKTDPSYYTVKINEHLPCEWEAELWPAGSRKEVLKLHQCFPWSRFAKRQILFFVDKDFTDFTNAYNINDENIYQTDFYSIENNLVTGALFKEILQDVLGLETLRGKEMRKVVNMFSLELKKFHKVMLVISSHLITWKSRGLKPCANNLNMKDIFAFKSGKLMQIHRQNGYSTVVAYLCQKLGLNRRSMMKELKEVQVALKSESTPKKYTRGKFEAWFFVNFCKHIHENICHFSGKVRSPPKTHINLSLKNFVSIVGPRSRTPDSLHEFLRQTVVPFSKEV